MKVKEELLSNYLYLRNLKKNTFSIFSPKNFSKSKENNDWLEIKSKAYPYNPYT